MVKHHLCMRSRIGASSLTASELPEPGLLHMIQPATTILRQGRVLTDFVVQAIGTLHTPWRSTSECPRNGRQPDPAPGCVARVFPEFVEGLQGLEGFSHLILVYWLDQVTQPRLTFTPPFDARPRGVFSTRAPFRPNPIGLSVVAFDRFDGLDGLAVRYLDCIDGTPLLDIKPYLLTTDSEPNATMGWLDRHATRNRNTAREP
jgi:tRNA-Thr(GGU) m(6)t(6)A37 methyltransferase TsaA